MRPFVPPIVLSLPLLVGACFERVQPSVESAVRPIEAVRVTLAPEGETRAFSGTIRPRREADVGFRASGRISERLVDAGARVKAGEVLARLDPVDLGLAVRSAAADLANAEAQLAQAQSDANRSRTLTAQGWNAAATDEVKQAAFRSARERVASATAALDLARNRLAYAELRAPYDGVVMAAVADPGTVVTEGQPVLRLAQAGALEAEVPLPESALSMAGRPGATLTLWAHPEAPVRVQLRELSPVADPKLRTFAARYAIPAEGLPTGFEPAIGMTATVHLTAGLTTRVANLPSAAVADRGQGPIVWVVDPNLQRLEARPITVRAIKRDRALVTGLRDGELVVGMGVQKLDPGAQVRVADIRPAGE